jgi:hypothetical protein
MGKLILAIIAVACLQVAFVVYVISDSPLSFIAVVPDPNPDGRSLDLASVNEPEPSDAASTPAIVPSLPAPRLARTTILAAERRQPVTESKAKRIRSPHQPNRVRPAETYVSRARPDADLRKGFTSTVILYNRDGALTADRTVKIKRDEKRSLMAKAAPILKKPWDLIKGIASKLN